MFDSTAIAAAELLSHFGKNTAVRIDHKYGHNVLNVVVARTGNVIQSVDMSTNPDLELVAHVVMAMKSFPRPRNMRRSWSPIRLNAKTEAMMEADSGIRFA